MDNNSFVFFRLIIHNLKEWKKNRNKGLGHKTHARTAGPDRKKTKRHQLDSGFMFLVNKLHV